MRDMSEATESRLLLARIRAIWETARSQAARSVNTAHVQANWLIGRQIVEFEQGGARRAAYGQGLLRNLSATLTAEYGDGFSLSAMKNMRAFFLAYPRLLEKGHALRGLSGARGRPTKVQISHAPRGFFEPVAVGQPGELHPALSWSHYRTLLKLDRPEVRDFYEIEAVRNAWSARELDRQVASLLYERLARSRDRKGVLELARRGNIPAEAHKAVKDPYVLEFLGLPESGRLIESDLEAALIARLQEFLLELGDGFAFVARQRRLTLDGDHFYADLVFYHVRLKCYVVIDLKVGKLTHGDLGQMLLYVNYFDREVVGPGDNPTIGLILCSEKNDAVAKYVLADRTRQIFASRYQLALPTADRLEAELRREATELAPISVPRSGRATAARRKHPARLARRTTSKRKINLDRKR